LIVSAPTGAERWAALAERGVAMLDAPVSGGVVARPRRATVVVGRPRRRRGALPATDAAVGERVLRGNGISTP
jgi:3-hydroxyisobutyrate dehydrogenase-like beta-hydroxyacid dehydrogenase